MYFKNNSSGCDFTPSYVLVFFVFHIRTNLDVTVFVTINVSHCNCVCLFNLLTLIFGSMPIIVTLILKAGIRRVCKVTDTTLLQGNVIK